MNLRIGVRRWIGFGLVIILMVIVVATAIGRMGTAERRVDNILNDRYRKIAMVTEIKYNVALIHQDMHDAMLAGSPADLQREVDSMTATRAGNESLLETFDKLINVPRARELFTAITQARASDLGAQTALLGRDRQ